MKANVTASLQQAKRGNYFVISNTYEPLHTRPARIALLRGGNRQSYKTLPLLNVSCEKLVENSFFGGTEFEKPRHTLELATWTIRIDGRNTNASPSLKPD